MNHLQFQDSTYLQVCIYKYIYMCVCFLTFYLYSHIVLLLWQSPSSVRPSFRHRQALPSRRGRLPGSGFGAMAMAAGGNQLIQLGFLGFNKHHWAGASPWNLLVWRTSNNFKIADPTRFFGVQLKHHWISGDVKITKIWGLLELLDWWI